MLHQKSWDNVFYNLRVKKAFLGVTENLRATKEKTDIFGHTL